MAVVCLPSVSYTCNTDFLDDKNNGKFFLFTFDKSILGEALEYIDSQDQRGSAKTQGEDRVSNALKSVFRLELF